MPPQDDIEYFGEPPEHEDDFPDDGLRPISSDDDDDDEYFVDEVSDDFPDDEWDDPAEAEDGEMPDYGK